jgi:hypothetical protein
VPNEHIPDAYPKIEVHNAPITREERTEPQRSTSGQTGLKFEDQLTSILQQVKAYTEEPAIPHPRDKIQKELSEFDDKQQLEKQLQEEEQRLQQLLELLQQGKQRYEATLAALDKLHDIKTGTEIALEEYDDQLRRTGKFVHNLYLI